MTGRPAKHLVLVGLPGVGKSTVGRGVAENLRRRFIDLDTFIERSIGKSIGRIFEEDGESAFRIAEAEASAAAARMGASVIAPGGGWVLNEAAKAHLLPCCRIIYLRVSPDMAVRRMGRGIARRPLLYQAEDPEAVMRELFDARREMYERSAELTVETGAVSKAKVIARVVELVLAAESNTSSTAGTND
ncbi:MAG: shikimate kinase [Gemmatimonadaceae bacterium]